MAKKSDYLRNMDKPTVLGYELDRETLMPIRHNVADLVKNLPTSDTGANPLGNGMFRMYPSGDVVDYAERTRRLTPTK